MSAEPPIKRVGDDPAELVHAVVMRVNEIEKRLNAIEERLDDFELTSSVTAHKRRGAVGELAARVSELPPVIKELA